MKKIILVTILLSIIMHSGAKSVNFDSTYKKTGWLVYFADEVVWAPSDIKKNTDDTDFFKSKQQYQNCISVSSKSEIFSKKEIAKKHLVVFATKVDSLSKKVIYADTGYIYILPVKVKIMESKKVNSGDINAIFFKNGAYINSLIYYEGSSRRIAEITPMRKKR